MFTLTSAIFFALIDILISAVLIGIGLIVLAVILYIVICTVRAMVKHEKNSADK